VIEMNVKNKTGQMSGLGTPMKMVLIIIVFLILIYALYNQNKEYVGVIKDVKKAAYLTKICEGKGKMSGYTDIDNDKYPDFCDTCIGLGGENRIKQNDGTYKTMDTDNNGIVDACEREGEKLTGKCSYINKDPPQDFKKYKIEQCCTQQGNIGDYECESTA